MRHITLPTVPDNVNDPFEKICVFMDAFCEEKLNKDYFNLSVRLAVEIACKRPSPFLSGPEKTWAAGIIHALGSVNLLFDKTQSPHLTADDLSFWFELGKSTISSKSKVIRDMLKIYLMDPHWCLPSKIMGNPFIWIVSCDGCIVDIREAPYSIQIAALEAGVIPFIPSKV